MESERLVAEWEAVRQSRLFQTAPQLRKMLDYIVRHSVDGQNGAGEMAIGLDVFGRDAADYEPRLDPIVRVMAVRVRRRLDDYYASEGAGRTARITVPKGSYAATLEAHAGGAASEGMPVEPAIAVLPLENFSGDAGQEYFADGMTEALITGLARVPGLRVISRTSVMRFKRTVEDLPSIAAALGVDYVLEGSVLHDGARVRIVTQLIAVRPERHLWAESYDRDLVDVLGLQQDVAEAVAGEIRLRLARPVAAAARPVAREAWLAYLRGMYHRSRRVPTDMPKAIEYFDEAIRLDPEFILAYAALADTAFFEVAYAGRLDLYLKARSAASRALALDGECSEAHSAMAAILTLDWNWKEARRHAERAIALDPNSSNAHWRLGFILGCSGLDIGAAVAAADTALRLDPLSAAMQNGRAFVLYWAGRYAEAIEGHQAVIAADPTFLPAYIHVAFSAMVAERFDEALAAMEAKKRVAPLTLDETCLLGTTAVYAGDRARGESIWEALPPEGPHFGRAALATALERFDVAVEHLERAAAAMEWKVGYLRAAAFRPLAGDARFRALLERCGLAG